MEQFPLSIVLVVNRRSTGLAAAVAECLAFAAGRLAATEIILVDDGCSRDLAQQIDRFAALHAPIVLMRYPQRRGYRSALYDAWGAARGSYLITLDLSRPALPCSLPRLLASAPGYAAVLPYREPPSHALRDRLLALLGRRHDATLRDPARGLALLRSDLRQYCRPTGSNLFVHAEIYATARQHGQLVTQVAKPGLAVQAQASLRPSFPNPPGQAHQHAALRAGIFAFASGWWLLRRWRRRF
ncbi:glycosyltransferase [Candidatus Chloroploca sp. Khr17]|uniref:glycosyltransferase n=1 Tax=Candidatus Chloroploca sp. Khr17 TaxID=2496869 RepID=UPI00101B5E7C|nr:glycosyltransferase [Candidatus Chloroploca sp. Khr17]